MMISKNYQLKNEIGQGTFGKVYLGNHSPTNSPIAIKILDKSKIKDQSDFDRVCRELTISQTILHPHLVHLYDILETDAYIFLIMEYLEGGELYDFIVSQNRLSEQETFQYFIQILNALEYLHQINIVHRDLKPENLLLDKDKKRIKLVDFGLGRFYNINSKIDTACGSPCYAPPEMLSKLKYDPLKADIWSLGIVLFAMLAGFLPFDDDNTDKLYEKIIEGQFQIPNWISPSAKDLLTKIINKNPEQRITMQGIKQHPWFQEMQKKTTSQKICCLNQNHDNFNKIDQSIVGELVQRGFEETQIIDHITKNNHSEIYCFYHILKNKKELKEPAIVPKIQPKRNFKKINMNIKPNFVSVKQNFQNKSLFKKYTGPIDLEFLSSLSPQELFKSLQEVFKKAKFNVEKQENGIFQVDCLEQINFVAQVVSIVDNDECSYLIFDKVKPTKEKFEKFYFSKLQTLLSPLFNQLQ